MIERKALERTLKLANSDAEMRDLVISLTGGYGASKRLTALRDLDHILHELENNLESVNTSP